MDDIGLEVTTFRMAIKFPLQKYDSGGEVCDAIKGKEGINNIAFYHKIV